jgi:hypothetical protein
LIAGDTLGVAPEAELIIGRIFGGSGGLTSWDILVEAMDWAVERGADVINVSLWSATLQFTNNAMIADAISRARQAGAVTVWIAGNGYDSSSAPLPASVFTGSSSPQAIIVGSASSSGVPSTWSRADAEVLAWGEDVTVARADPFQPYATGVEGTSYSAPRIAGAIAQMLADGAPRDPDWLEWVVLHEAIDHPEISYVEEGYGFFGADSLNNARAVAAGTRPVPGADARDAFHIATSAGRTAVTGSAPRGILPPGRAGPAEP